MRRLRPLLPAAVALLAAASGGTPAHAADLTSEGSNIRFAGPVDAGRSLAVFIRAVQGESGFYTLDVLARRVDADGEPVGRKVLVGQGAAPGPSLVGDPFAVAYDTRRDRWLVAWSGREQGMAEADCGAAPAGPVPTLRCYQAKREIFVRIIGRDGSVVGPPHRVTATGVEDDAFATGAVPALAYDRRADAFMLASVAFTPRQPSTLVTQALRPTGYPSSTPRVLPAGTGGVTTRVVADQRGGFMLAYTAGAGSFGSEELFTRALDARGEPEGEPVLVSQAGPPGVSGLDVVANGRDLLALWTEAGPGEEGGTRARRLAASGTPSADTMNLVFPRGTSAVTVASFGSGWLYGFVADRPQGNHAVLVRRARRDGDPFGESRVVSEDDATTPTVADAGHGRALIGWTHAPVSRMTSDPPPPLRPRVALARP